MGLVTTGALLGRRQGLGIIALAELAAFGQIIKQLVVRDPGSQKFLGEMPERPGLLVEGPHRHEGII